MEEGFREVTEYVGLEQEVGRGGLGHRLVQSGETQGPWRWWLQERSGRTAAPGLTKEPGAGGETGV